MEVETFLKPNVSEDLAVELTRRLYGLEVLSISRMVSKKHRNPYISQVLDGGYNLKITNVNRSAIVDHFDSMHASMIHLSEKDLKVPVPVKNLEGHTWNLEQVPLLNKEADADGDKLCGIHLLTYIPGVPISKVPYTTDILFQWGQMLAKYHHAVEDFQRASLLKKQFLWQLEYVPELRNYMDGIEGEKAKLVNSVLEQYPEEIEKNMDKLPKGIIHGDFNENNILVESTDAKSYRVSGILDFEDIHHGTYVWDLGVTLAYTLLDCKTMDPLDGAGHALAGYLSHRKLNELELSLLKMCIQCRLCQSLVMCAHSYRSDPTNTYLLTSSKTGWDRLEQICNTKNEDLLQRWREIKEQYSV